MTTGNAAGQSTAGSVETMLQHIMGMLEKSVSSHLCIASCRTDVAAASGHERA
jgi:hypothetical protein